MNCKPGDLAVVVRGEHNVGRFLSVLAASECHGIGWWYVEMHGGPATAIDGEGKTTLERTGHIEDHRLRPIRDPGDDARDETLDWLPVPKREEPDVWTPKRQVEKWADRPSSPPSSGPR
jgi:hypothetical protein